MKSDSFIHMRRLAPCQRCTITQVDPETGKFRDDKGKANGAPSLKWTPKQGNSEMTKVRLTVHDHYRVLRCDCGQKKTHYKDDFHNRKDYNALLDP